MSLMPACVRPGKPEAWAGDAEAPSPASLGLRELVQQKLHHGPDRFINPFSAEKHGNLWTILRWKLLHRNRFEPFFRDEKVVPVSVRWKPVLAHKGASVTFLKHATVLISDNGWNILVDPVLSAPFWFIKDFSPLAFDVHDIPKPDQVLITHGHYDHLDTTSLAVLPEDTHVITPLGYNGVFRSLGMRNRTTLDWFEAHEDRGRSVVLLPCNHWTMRNAFLGPNRSLWGSFYIRTAAGPGIFVSGDTAYFEGFRELGREFPVDLAIFNLGAYQPRWFMAKSHVNPAEVVRAFRDLNAARLLIVHWGTFRLGDEPVHFPPVELRRELEAAGLADRWIPLDHGQTLYFRKDGGVDV